MQEDFEDLSVVPWYKETSSERARVCEVGQAALDWQRLYDWTQAQVPGAILGRSCTNSEDPLGAYLGSATQTRAEVWSVGPSIKTGYEDRLNKPEWIKRLITETDIETGHQSAPITREMYLKVLERIRPQ